MIKNLGNAFKIAELKKRIFFTLAMLAVYRLGCHIPTPGINGEILTRFFEQQNDTLFGMFDMFSGGAMGRASVFSLGIMPYISAEIIMQLMAAVVPYLEAIKQEGQEGQKKIKQISRYLTLVLASIQSFGVAVMLQNMADTSIPGLVPNPGVFFILNVMLTLVTGTILLMWIGEQMTERGIGNGVSLLIFVSIISGLPTGVINTWTKIQIGELQPLAVMVVVGVMVGITVACVYVGQAHRNVPIQYARRMVGRQVAGGQSSYLPIKVEMSGVIAVIFASSIVLFIATMSRYIPNDFTQSLARFLAPGELSYSVVYVALIIFFCYFYNAITFNPADIADNLKKSGGYIPGIRPGKDTADFIDRVLTRLTLIGSLFVSVIALVPIYLGKWLDVPFYFGGTGLLIIVGVTIDTMSQIEAHMISRNYDGFMKSNLDL